ncbi:MAG: DMT family transporter, partial [Proteobacteria bacterium]|nr:DMT family transporter [Pseudomonadota bacterium]
MNEAKGRTQAALAALIGASFLGLSPIAIRVSEVGAQPTNFWRFAFALPILGLWAILSRPKPSLGNIGWLLLAGVLFGIEVSLWGAAVTLTTVTNATLLANLTPIFAAVFGWLLLRERLSASILAGIGAALTGAAILALARAQGAVHRGEHGLLGDALGFSAAIGYAGYLLIVRAVGARVGVGGVMFWATLSAMIVSLSASLVLREPLLAHTLPGWAMLVALGVVVQVGGQGFIAFGVGRLPIAISTVLLWMQPLVAAALSWVMFDEALSPLALGGAALILAGIY